MKIIDKYNTRVDATNTLVCVGLDTVLENAMAIFPDSQFPIFEFNKWIIKQTHEYAAAFKLNFTFYDGENGWLQLQMTIDYLNSNYPDVVTIADAKPGKVELEREDYAELIFDELGFDAITLRPDLGKQALSSFLNRADKACIITCSIPDEEAVGFHHDLVIPGKSLWESIAEQVSQNWNVNNNCMLVVGAMYLNQLEQIREMAREMTLLIPGIGAGGGDTEKVVKAAKNAEGKGIMINSSRGIIYSNDPGKAARQLRDEINQSK